MILHILLIGCVWANASLIPRAESRDSSSISSISSHLQMLRNDVHGTQSSCIEFFLGDTFGAGWKYASLYVYDDEGNFDSYSPNKTSNNLNVKYCYHPKSKSLSKSILGSHIEKKWYPSKNITLYVTMQYFHPIHPTSMTWSVRNLKSGDLYTGNHLTKMVFRFQETAISFGYAQNLVASRLNPAVCKSCSTGLVIPSRNNSRNSASSPSPDKVKAVTGIVVAVAVAAAAAVPIAPVLPTLDTKLGLSLFGKDGSWFHPDGLGTTYEISRAGGSRVLFAGRLCNGDNGGGGGPICPMKLSAGQYIWRVNGALDPHRDAVAWTFCDTQGGARMELFFEINDEGNCIPGRLRFANDDGPSHLTKKSFISLPEYAMHEGSGSSSDSASDSGGLLEESTGAGVLILQGAIDLTGLNSVIISDHEKRMLAHFVDTLICDAKLWESPRHPSTADSYAVQLLAWQEVMPEAFYKHGHRDAKVVVDRVTFTIQIHRKEFNIPSEQGQVIALTDYDLLMNLKRFLAISMESGAFLAKIRAKDNSNLNVITKAKLVDLEIFEDDSPSDPPFIFVPEDFILLLAVGVGVLLGFCLFYFRYSLLKDTRSKVSTLGTHRLFSFSIIPYVYCISGLVSGSPNKRSVTLCDSVKVTIRSEKEV